MAVANTLTHYDRATIKDVKKCVAPAINFQLSPMLECKVEANPSGASC